MAPIVTEDFCNALCKNFYCGLKLSAAEIKLSVDENWGVSFRDFSADCRFFIPEETQ